MKIALSLFDGMSCGQLALQRAGISVDYYLASEVDKAAMAVAKKNFPDMEHIGDVREVDGASMVSPFILMGGSPCQSFSFAGTRKGMSTEQGEEITTLERYLELKSEGFAFSGQSYLFWEFVRILRETNPRYFLLENVCMAKKWERVISDVLNVEPILIDSRLVSAQMRRRLYWTNIPGVTQPKDRGIKLHTILDGVDAPQLNKGAIVGRRLNAFGKREDYNKGIPVMQCLEVRDINRDKSNCLTTVAKDTVLTPLPVGRYPNVFKTKEPFRYYALSECCRLQTVPENYFQGVSEHQAKKLLGNGWTVEVIAHILSHIPQEER